ncbi:class I adenylate-forming enzyme family protein [Microbulbifer thermotolerans]|uniref:class I adenylate-forming enzyme family protein n=1 Tax=Microbulbifer thermotolerans TaxID=252514 RepID=UPI0008F28137|nr:AMP-binding protein [Microbulbifer thermotolerans]MCX2834008.1 AMP-binding protein [Microbulbifer thermotolerans]SFC37861.1 benzoate-CoA ligase [Microbulbifer thermotolerans]
MNLIDPSPGCVDLLVDRHVRAGRGDHPALVERDACGRRSLTYRELQQRTLAAAQELQVRLAGSRSQQRIALVGAATLENIVYWLGAMRAGHLPFNVHPALPPEHYASLWEDFDPTLVLADRTAAPAAEAEPMTAVEELVVAGAAEGQLREVSDLAADLDRRPALVLATSGSTGRPKLCVHSHRAFWAFARNVSRAMWDIREDDRVLASTGPFFSFGLQGLHAPLACGATAVTLPEWQQHTDFLEVMESESVSVFLAVPTLYHLLMSRACRPYRLDALRLSLSAGERLPPIIRERWQAWSNSQMLDSIGTTETFAPYLSESAASVAPDNPHGLQRVGGFHYTETPHGSDGDFSLSLSEGCLMLGYLSPGSGLLQEVPTPFATRDLFTRTGAGVRFVSRDSERIKVAGHWVSPQELEEFLLADTRVLKAAALPLETAEGLTRLRAFVVADTDGYSAEALIDSLMKRIREQLHPRALRPDRIELVEDIATTPSGKIKRQELRSLVGRPVARAGALLAR